MSGAPAGTLARALLGLGSNLGDRDANIARGLELLVERGGGELLAVSTLRTTAPVGGPRQPDFRNGAALLDTHLAPRELLALLQSVEQAVGRSADGERWGPRQLDLDLLLHGATCVAAPGIEIPHPRMTERRFVLEPAAEVAPDMLHPRLGRTVRELLEALE